MNRPIHRNIQFFLYILLPLCPRFHRSLRCRFLREYRWTRCHSHGWNEAGFQSTGITSSQRKRSRPISRIGYLHLFYSEILFIR